MQKLVSPDDRFDGELSSDPTAEASLSSPKRPMQHEKEIADALASLQLPHMPETSSHSILLSSASSSSSLPPCDPPTIRILVCADLDLHSTSALAEYVLQQKLFDATLVDLIIAAGPFSRYDDLAHYSSSGHRYRPKLIQHRRPEHACFRENDDISRLIPFFRTREETAALEGLMTAALSQLESIVCRVVYCPGYSDPLTTAAAATSKRLTPNSRNIHRQWLPLAPGLGCAGMFYIDGADKLMNLGNTTVPTSIHPAGNAATTAAPATAAAGASATAAYEAEDESSEEEDSMVIFSEHLNQIRQSSSGYCDTLSKLVKLAPRLEHPMNHFRPESDKKCQSILVTHYIDSKSLLQQDDFFFEDDEKAFDALHSETKQEASGMDSEKPHGIDDESLGASLLPWPADHASFLNESDTRKLLCMEIASGSAPHHRPAWINETGQYHSSSEDATKSTSSPRSYPPLQSHPLKRQQHDHVPKGPVLFPGSLRERGEFCILHLSLTEPAKTTKSVSQFTWQVENVYFYNIHD